MTSPPDPPVEDRLPAQDASDLPEPETQQPRRATEPQRRDLVVRRAPRVGVFLVIGAVLGVLAAFVVTVTGPQNPDFTFGTIFGFFVVVLAMPGVAVGGLVWLVLDRLSKRRAYTVHAEAVEDPSQADLALDAHDLQQWHERWKDGDRDSDPR